MIEVGEFKTETKTLKIANRYEKRNKRQQLTKDVNYLCYVNNRYGYIYRYCLFKIPLLNTFALFNALIGVLPHVCNYRTILMIQ